MRIVRTICAPALVLAIPAFIAFQIAARPMVSCGKNACELMVQIMPCTMVQVDAVDEPVAEMGGCCQKKAPPPEPTGCRNTVETSSPCSRCTSVETSVPVRAESHAAGDDSEEPQCPGNAPLCGLCPLIPVAAEPAAKTRAPDVRVHVLPIVHCSATLTQSYEGLWEKHNHAPHTTILARAGPDRRVELCSFLL
ncbi:MAG: hypothetical protein Kow0074_19400 [Candidatus Zixiibacteriota bacterium]